MSKRGEELGCPDCIAGEVHCCPFLWADKQPEPERTQILKHIRYYLQEEMEIANANTRVI